MAFALLTVGGADQPHVLASDDGGATWQVDNCPAAAQQESLSCVAMHSGGNGMWHLTHHVSADDGRTWSPVRLQDGAASDGREDIDGIVSSRTEAGWGR